MMEISIAKPSTKLRYFGIAFVGILSFIAVGVFEIRAPYSQSLPYASISFAYSLNVFLVYRKIWRCVSKILILDDGVKFYYHNNHVDPKIVKFTSLNVEVSEEKVDFRDKLSSKLVARIYRELVEDSSLLEEILAKFDSVD